MLTKAISDTTDKIKTNIEEKKKAEHQQREDARVEALGEIENPVVLEFIDALGISKLELSTANIQKVKKVFPIPVEQTVVWVDAEFDLRPSGIAITDQGIFIKSDVSVFGNKKEKQKSQLLYFKWDSFNASWFVSDSIEENKALLVNEKCSASFIETCKKISKHYIDNSDEHYQYFSSDEKMDDRILQVAPVAVAGVKSSESAVFVEQKAHIKNPAGHGEMVEEATTMLDKLWGVDAKVIGRDNYSNKIL